MGINLDDPKVKKVLELLEKQHELEELKKKFGPTPGIGSNIFDRNASVDRHKHEVSYARAITVKRTQEQ
jgi:hypothetical protein